MKISPCCGSEDISTKLVGDEVWSWCAECGNQIEPIETCCPICGIDLYDAVVARGEDAIEEHITLFHGVG